MHISDEKVKFFINTAHDLRTPITLIKAPLEELSENTTLTAEAKEAIELALRNTNTLAEMTDKVMTLGEELLAVGKALTVAAMQDEARWGTIGRHIFLEPASVYTLKDYEAHYRYLYDWYMDRWVWLCKHFDVI